MLRRIALLAIAAPRWVVAAAVLVTLAAGIFGVPVAKSLSSSGFQDPASESARATQLLTDKFHQGDLQMLITVTAPDSANSPAARAVGLSIVDQLRRVAERRRSEVGVDCAACRGERPCQQGRQDWTDRRGHQRRGERRAEHRPNAVRRGGARPSGRGDGRHRPAGRGRHGERADQLPSCSTTCC